MSPPELAECSILFHTFPSISSLDAIRSIQAIWKRCRLHLLQLMPQSTHLIAELCLATVSSTTGLVNWYYWRKGWKTKGATFLLSANYKLHWDVVTDGRSTAAAGGSVPFHLPVSALPLSRWSMKIFLKCQSLHLSVVSYMLFSIWEPAAFFELIHTIRKLLL